MLTERLARALNEPVMGFLALAALVFGLTPELFPVTPAQHAVLAAGEWLIVGLFALEYAVHWVRAPSKRAYMLDPWRMLDLVIIVAPLASLIPGTPEAARSSPVLRVLRLLRAILAGTRASTRLRQREAAARRAPPSGPPVAMRLGAEAHAPARIDWPDVLAWIAGPSRGWVHASNLEPARLEELARATRLTRTALESALGPASSARLDAVPRWATLTLALPRADGTREPLLLLVGEEGVLSLSLYPGELPIAARPPAGTAPGGWPLRIALSLVRTALARHEELALRTEGELRALEDIPPDETPRDFMALVFALRKRIAASKSDLWRLRALLRAVAEGRRSLPGVDAAAREEVARIADEADALHDTADSVRESLLSLLDLHLNVSGYGMNRFMRLLAIVSALALIPAVIGGLLGMNLADNPWPATLPQVAFGVLILMLSMLYTFLAKGWLK